MKCFLKLISSIALLCSLVMTLSGSSTETLIGSFDPEGVKKYDFWQSSNPQYPSIKLESKWVWPDQASGYCGKVTFFQFRPDLKPKMHSIPALVMGRNLSCRNWSNGAALLFDTYADEECAINISIYNNNSALYRIDGIKIPKGRKRHRVEIQTGNDLSVVKTLLFFMPHPSRTCVFFLGSVRLEERDLAVKKSEYQTMINHISDRNFDSLDKDEAQTGRDLLAACRNALAKWNTEQFSLVRNKIPRLQQLVQKNAILRDHPDDPLITLWTNSLDRVYRTRQIFLSMPQKSGFIDAARGEDEGCFFVALPQRRFGKVRVRVKNYPVSSDGKKIPLEALSVQPVGYVYCKASAADRENPGWYPDPILPYAEKLDLDKDCWQSWYLELRVPREQSPGEYRGSVAISAYGFKERELPFTVRVRNFTLAPGEAYLGIYDLGHPTWEAITWLEPYQAPDPEYRQKLYRKLTDMVLEHRLNPDQIYSRRRMKSAEEISSFLKKGARGFNIAYLTCGIGTAEQSKQAASAYLQQVEKKIDEYRKAGILDKAYIYGYDETAPHHFGRIKAVTQEIKKKYPNIPIYTTAGDPSLGTDGKLPYIDGFCPVIDRFEKNPDLVAKARKAGKKVFWYIACGPLAPYPNFLIEYPLIGSRFLMGAMYWKFKPDGFLYYSLASWGRFVTKENGSKVYLAQGHMEGAPLTTYDPMSFADYNGDGCLIYPSASGPVPSLRLKAIRDGIEDYLYLQMLADALEKVKKQQIKMPESWQNAASKALEIKSPLVASLTEYTQNPDDLLTFRATIADLLEAFFAAK